MKFHNCHHANLGHLTVSLIWGVLYTIYGPDGSLDHPAISLVVSAAFAYWLIYLLLFFVYFSCSREQIAFFSISQSRKKSYTR